MTERVYFIRNLFLVIMFVFTFGCISIPKFQKADESILLDITPIPGVDGQCGACAVCSVLEYYKLPETPSAELAGQVKAFCAQHNVNTLDMVAMLRKCGAECSFGRFDYSVLIDDILNHRPVLLLFDTPIGFLNESVKTPLHCWVLTGYDIEKRRFIYNDPFSGPNTIGRVSFVAKWRRFGILAIRIVPPNLKVEE